MLNRSQNGITHGNWSIRQGIIFGDLAFVNQVNGGDEWWTLKRFAGEWYQFESITFAPIIAQREFASYLDHLQSLTLDNSVFSYAKAQREQWELVDGTTPFDEPNLKLFSSLIASERIGAMLYDPCYADFLAFVNEVADRFAVGDWGDLQAIDRQQTTQPADFKMGEYVIPAGVEADGEKKVWIIHDGVATTILFPSEY